LFVPFQEAIEPALTSSDGSLKGCKRRGNSIGIDAFVAKRFFKERRISRYSPEFSRKLTHVAMHFAFAVDGSERLVFKIPASSIPKESIVEPDIVKRR